MDKRWLPILGKLTYGIYVLTSHFEETINGMIASWVSQISYDPPLMMVAVHPHRYTHELIQKSGHFALNFLSRNQRDLLHRFKGPDPAAKFTSISWRKGETGCPILEECLAYLECVVRERHDPGNHSLFIGEIINAQIFFHEEPLSTLDYEGIYTGKD
jgi:flavin reductase (DIM6/NTAB) family NADH-FMN oxidoreductase RutF